MLKHACTIYVVSAILVIGCEKKKAPCIVQRCENATSITVYDIDPIRNREVLNSPVDAFENLPKAEFDLEVFQQLIAHAEHKDPEISKLPRTGSLAIVRFPHKPELRLGMPRFGKHFIVLGEDGRYYCKDKKVTQQWRNEYKRIAETVFGPIRIARNRKEAIARLDKYIRDLQDGGFRQKMMATDMIGELGADAAAAIPALIKALDDENPEIRHNAVWALGQIGPPAKSAIPALEKCLDDKMLRNEATRSIRQISETPDMSSR